MTEQTIKNIKVRWFGIEDPEENELLAYVDRGIDKYPEHEITQIDLHPDGEEVEIKYTFSSARRFHRLRRITGYLVGSLERWNDGKAAEERDRVKHNATILSK